MSRVSTKKNANSVESVGGAEVLAFGAVVVGACLLGLAKGISSLVSARPNRIKSLATNTIDSVKSVATLSRSAPVMQVPASANLEETRERAFEVLAQQPYLVSNPKSLEAGVEKLEQASSVSEIQAVYSDVILKLEYDHQLLFTNSLIAATKRAALRSGFQTLQDIASPLPTCHRFAATDSNGRTIVTEINAPLNGEVHIDSEVIGVTDGSCADLLVAFDEALAAEGVKSQKPEHRPTGGVCELDAVRKFVAAQPTPVAMQCGAPTQSRQNRRRSAQSGTSRVSN
jgi:hypothetical protein